MPNPAASGRIQASAPAFLTGTTPSRQNSVLRKATCRHRTGGMVESCGDTTWEKRNMNPKLDLLQGTLDLLVLRTLVSMGSLHGYGIARRIEQLSGDEVLLNQGTIYAALVRLQNRGWIAAEWGASENNRRAKFYSITRSGRNRLAVETSYWQRLSAVIGRVLAPAEGAPK